MLHITWSFLSLLIILVIILQNPKAQSAGTQGQVFGGTRANEDLVNKLTWILSVIFLFLTILISVFDN
jgi:preprotein translocase subunit SecG